MQREFCVDNGLASCAAVSKNPSQLPVLQNKTAGPQLYPLNLHSKEGYCYIWDESEGDLSSDGLPQLQYRHYKTVIKENP